jgi:hypothetical protein
MCGTSLGSRVCLSKAGEVIDIKAGEVIDIKAGEVIDIEARGAVATRTGGPWKEWRQLQLRLNKLARGRGSSYRCGSCNAASRGGQKPPE